VSFIAHQLLLLYLTHCFSSLSFLTIELINMIASLAPRDIHRHAIVDLMLLNRHWHNSIVGAPRLFSDVVIASHKSAHTVSYLLSLSRQVPLKIVYAITLKSSSHDIHGVTSHLVRHSHRIHHLSMRCIDWRIVGNSLAPFAMGPWTMLQQVEVMGYGLGGGMHYASFAGWELELLWDLLQRGSSTIARVCMHGSAKQSAGAYNDLSMTSNHLFLQHSFTYHGYEDDLGQNALCSRPDLQMLQVSCLSGTSIPPIVEMLSAHPHRSLTTLSMHARFHIMESISITAWTTLAMACPFIKNLSLPYGDGNLLHLLDINPNIWPSITRLQFYCGPSSLSQLVKVVARRHISETPLKSIGLCQQDWDPDDVSDLKEVVEVILSDREWR
jgi:hypothetical protein